MAAENGLLAAGAIQGGAASMRPRRMAAENLKTLVPMGCQCLGFNEAAANGRGKRQLVPRGGRADIKLQ